MDVIYALKNANILAEPVFNLGQEDLLLFQNHSLDNEYEICGLKKCKKVTILMLLINLLYKYPSSSSIINNIIKMYIEKVPEEVYKINEYCISAMFLCAFCSFVETIEILLNKGININYQYYYGWTVMHIVTNYMHMDECGLNIVKLLIDYDANTNIKDKDGDNAIELCSDNDSDKVSKILENIVSLNIKN